MTEETLTVTFDVMQATRRHPDMFSFTHATTSAPGMWEVPFDQIEEIKAQQRPGESASDTILRMIDERTSK